MGDPFCSLSTQQNGTQSAFFCVPRQVHISLKTSSTFEQQCPGGAINTPLFAMTAHNSFHSDNTSKNEPTFTENIAQQPHKIKVDKMNVATCLPKLISCEMLPSLPFPTPPQKLNITPVTLVRKDQAGLTGHTVVPCFCWRNQRNVRTVLLQRGTLAMTIHQEDE